MTKAEWGMRGGAPFYTVGHSTRSVEELVELLSAASLVASRSPTPSRKLPALPHSVEQPALASLQRARSQ